MHAALMMDAAKTPRGVTGILFLLSFTTLAPLHIVIRSF